MLNKQTKVSIMKSIEMVIPWTFKLSKYIGQPFKDAL